VGTDKPSLLPSSDREDSPLAMPSFWPDGHVKRSCLEAIKDCGGRERSLANAERTLNERCIIRERPDQTRPDQTRLEHCTWFYGVEESQTHINFTFHRYTDT
jgi:hypothetical protein